MSTIRADHVRTLNGKGEGVTAFDYEAGLVVDSYSQIIRNTSGEFWRLSGSTSLPYTTTGEGLPEAGAFVPADDSVLRQELQGDPVDGNGSALVNGIYNLPEIPASIFGVTLNDAQQKYGGFRLTGLLTGDMEVIVPDTERMYTVVNDTAGDFTVTVKTALGSGVAVDQGQTFVVRCNGTDVVRGLDSQRTICVGSVAEGVSGLTGVDGQAFDIVGWHTDSEIGGGEFVYRSSVAKSQHNGGTIISPTVPAVSAQTGATENDRILNFLNGVGEIDGTGSGVFVRTVEDKVYRSSWFGIKAGPSDVVPTILSTGLLNYLTSLAKVDRRSVLVNAGGYLVNGDGVRYGSNVNFFGEGHSGASGTVFFADTGSTSVVRTDSDTTAHHSFSLAGNFKIRGESNAVNGFHGLFMTNTSHLSDVRIDFCENNFHLQKGYYCSFANIQCRFGSKRNFYLNGDSTFADSLAGIQGASFYSCFANMTAGNNVEETGYGKANSWYSCTFENSDLHSNYHTGQMSSTMYFNCYWEGNGRTEASPSDVYINANTVNSGSVCINGGYVLSGGGGDGGFPFRCIKGSGLTVTNNVLFGWSGNGTRPKGYIYSRAQYTDIGPFKADYNISGPNNDLGNGIYPPRMYENHMAHGVLAADLSLTAGVYTKVPYDSGNYDPQAELISGTFTCKAPGYYKVNATAFMNVIANNDSLNLAIFLNGINTREVRDNVASSGAEPQTLEVSATLLVNQGDTIEVHARNLDSSASVGGGTDRQTYLEIYRMN